jgi:cardiolipin synthase
MTTFLSTVTVLGYLLTLLLIRRALATKKRHPASNIAWILTIVMLPFLGSLLFVLFGINRVQRRAVHKRRITEEIGSSLPELSQYHLVAGEGLNPQQDCLMRLSHRIAGTLPTLGNRIELLTDTNRTLGLIEQAILSAKESLHLEYYIWQPDRTGTRLRDMLIEKANDGVTIRFLYDTFGSMRLSNRFLKPMRDAGIEVASFLPGTTFRERWSINLRNHRKIVIVDGRTGFTGGMNIGNEYLGKDPHLGFWRDTHLKITGPCVLQLQQVFAEDWCYATGEELVHPDLFPHPDESGSILAQVLAGGPSGDVDVFFAILFATINEAREQILLSTSYFVPPSSLATALESAAYRGVKVRLMVAGKAEYQWTVLAGRSYYDSLLKAGVEIYEYERGLQHAKTLTIDGNWSFVGTPNFDARSLLLNFEVGVVMYDKNSAIQLESQFDDDVKHSRRIDPARWPSRSAWNVMGENVSRLFAPVM